MKPLVFILFSFILIEANAQFTNMKVLTGKIEFKKKLSYSESLKVAKKLDSVKGMENIWVRKMGPNQYGVSFMMSFDGTKSAKHKVLGEFRTLLGGAIESWDLGTGLTWVKKTSLDSIK